MMLNVSIVLYHPDWAGEVIPLVEELLRIVYVHTIYLVDNSETEADKETLQLLSNDRVHYVFTGENVGYGRGHNIALRESIYDGIKYHLVLNSDILLKAEDIDSLCAFMETQPLVGQLMPRVVYPNGEIRRWMCSAGVFCPSVGRQNTMHGTNCVPRGMTSR